MLFGLILALVLGLAPVAGFAQTAEAGTCAYVHTVQAGETLASIAARYGLSAETLAQVNGITNPNWIAAGTNLCIPGQAAPPPHQPPASEPPAHKPPASKPATYCTYHWVKAGQTLSWIAKHYGVNMWTLVSRNNISNPNRIYAGQKLLIYCTTPPKPKPQPKPPYYPPPPQPGDGPAPSPACSITPMQGFGRVWYHQKNVAHKLGCPTQPETGFGATEQGFKNGYVVQDNDSRTIYVLYNNHTWETYPDTWQSGDPVINSYLVPPRGYYQPEYGIGKMWRNNDNVSQRLGWATYPQRGVTATRQSYERGWMLWTSSSGVYVLYNDGTWQHFN
jgi:LysM repeat protein